MQSVRRMCVTSVLILLMFILINVLITCGNLVNFEVHRFIDISTQLTVVHYNITLKNDGFGIVTNFEFYVEPDIRHSLSYIEASSYESSIKRSLKVIEVKENEFDIEAWQINLKKLIQAEQSLKVEIIAVFTHQLHPYPAYIVQDDKQLVNYTGNYYFYSPYFSVKQTTVIACSSDRFESYSVVEPTSQFKNVITYGPYKNIPPFSIQKQTVHYENNESFLTITNMERVITVSHWGNIAVEETIELLHKGAILTGKFSRYDYEENRKKFTTGLSSISTFTTILPASAKDIYYKDMIGNVSSSRLRILSDSIEMQIQPRFPLYGGWKISYTIGYNLPSYEYLYNNGEDYALRMRVLDHVYDNMVVDELVTKIILPEHCTDIWLFTPYPMTRLPDTKYYSYLDIVGRPVIIVAKGNMVVYHIQDFELHYVFPYSMMIIEPLLIIAVLFFVLVLVIIIIRLDFSIASSSDFETSSPMQSLSSVQKKARCKSVMKE